MHTALWPYPMRLSAAECMVHVSLCVCVSETRPYDDDDDGGGLISYLWMRQCVGLPSGTGYKGWLRMHSLLHAIHIFHVRCTMCCVLCVNWMDFYVFPFRLLSRFALAHMVPAIVLVSEFVHRMGVIALCACWNTTTTITMAMMMMKMMKQRVKKIFEKQQQGIKH